MLYSLRTLRSVLITSALLHMLELARQRRCESGKVLRKERGKGPSACSGRPP